MIYYNTRDIVSILTTWTGSPFVGTAPVQAFSMACFALIVATFQHFFPTDFDGLNTSIALKDLHIIANTFIGLLISFRLNSAFQQWKSGLGDITLFTQTARSVVSTFASFLTKSDDSTELLEKKEMLGDFRRLTLIYTSLVFHDCREHDALPELQSAGWLSPNELNELNACGAIYTSRQSKRFSSASAATNRARSAVIELWIRRVVQAAASKNYLNPPQMTTMNNMVTQLPMIHGRVFNTSNIPIPFNYCQYLNFCIYMYLVLYTVVIVDTSLFYTPGWVFLWGMVLLVADTVANEIECPFGTDANDIDLEERMKQLEDELTTLVRSQLHCWGLFTADDVAMLTPAPKTPMTPDVETCSLYGSKPRKLKVNRQVGPPPPAQASETSALLPPQTLPTQTSTGSNESYGIAV
ncbi:hypothetical protein SPRG_08121 [Saprolegnia parasitica CBS 223.65]|uniref:Bestrophin homolog n=1 Tax=Saprolegnia parasitica (strain CBS 223.65) TaxID=695850 RepID=A0A067CCC8_SAPPC|nr:hypothetical protein SPRG_08121 [Saprolegnia parasitica CBS 223.65]KDO26830.1 hypothetical protein SPRG_08121 [Saprolegnia parasitica CBS 223.65]|eukprot:XP_012202476.1 hypothetical protein SPRG_08121 [Saprolegnia parasitica CBS 223.65]